MRIFYLFVLPLFIFLCFIGFSLSSSNNDENTNSDSSHGHSEGASVLLFMFLGLSVGVVVHQITSRTKIGDTVPYAVIIFLMGTVFSFILSLSNKGTALDESIQLWLQIDPEMIIYVLLPPLIFGESMTLNWFHIKLVFFQAFALAGPGVLAGTFMMGCAAKLLLPYNWNWTLSFLFGAILAPTDTVAVLSLLKSTGASPKLTMIIVAESLMNDGTAMVLFTLFLRMLKGETFSIIDIGAYFLNGIFGSLLLGLFLGLIVLRWLRSARRPLREDDVITQTVITICSAYLIFYFTQGTLSISGPLACFGSGLILSWLGGPIILNPESLHTVWCIIEWISNTLIFLISGLIIGYRTIYHVNLMDWVYLIILYVIITLIRFVTVVGLLPAFLSRSSPDKVLKLMITRYESVFISWAGLKGAVAMALALIAEAEGGYVGENEVQKERLFFFTGGLVIMTLLINATTAKAVLRRLGLLEDEHEFLDKIITHHVANRLRNRMDKLYDELSKDLRLEDLDKIRRSCSVFNRPPSFRATAGKSEYQLRESGNLEVLRDAAANGIINNDSTINLNEDQTLSSSSFNGCSESDSSKKIKILPSFLFRPSKPLQQQPRETMATSIRPFRSSGYSSSVGSHSALSRPSRSSLSGPIIMSGMDRLSNNASILMRRVFLDIVKAKYWKFICSGKLPRLSYSSQFLLYSIEVANDQIEMDCVDWKYIENFIVVPPKILKLLNFLESSLPHWLAYHVLRLHYWIARIEFIRRKRAVYILTSFIEAQQYAQEKLDEFFNLVKLDNEFESEDLQGNRLSVEEIQRDLNLYSAEVLNMKLESSHMVHRAKDLLRVFPRSLIEDMRAKQVALTILSNEATIVQEMHEEGLITKKISSHFLNTVTKDSLDVDDQRNELYKREGARLAQRRWRMKKASRVVIDRSRKLAEKREIIINPSTVITGHDGDDDDNNDSNGGDHSNSNKARHSSVDRSNTSMPFPDQILRNPSLNATQRTSTSPPSPPSLASSGIGNGSSTNFIPFAYSSSQPTLQSVSSTTSLNQKEKIGENSDKHKSLTSSLLDNEF